MTTVVISKLLESVFTSKLLYTADIWVLSTTKTARKRHGPVAFEAIRAYRTVLTIAAMFILTIVPSERREDQDHPLQEREKRQ